MAAIDSEQLRRALEMRSMTPTQLADRVGITLSYAARILNGHRKLKRNPVLRRSIAEAIGVPVHWIETERPDPERVA